MIHKQENRVDTPSSQNTINIPEMCEKYHRQMGKEHRVMWNDQGIVDYSIDMYKLSYYPEYKYAADGMTHLSPTMTIPHHNLGWVPVRQSDRCRGR